MKRQKILAAARGELGVREYGSNAGPDVEKYLRSTGLGKGYAWCAAFITWIYGSCGYKQPKTAWSPALFTPGRLVTEPKAGDVLGIYFAQYGRIAHCGIVEEKRGDWVLSIEGNTNMAGSREGDGVYRKRRNAKTIAKYACWLN